MERWLSPVEGARLEIVYTVTRIVGSNPTLSATFVEFYFALGGGVCDPLYLSAIAELNSCQRNGFCQNRLPEVSDVDNWASRNGSL